MLSNGINPPELQFSHLTYVNSYGLLWSMSTLNLTPAQLRQAAVLKEKIAALEKKLAKIVGAEGVASLMAGTPVKKSKFSPAAIARIRAAQKIRWAKLKEQLAKHAA